MKVVNDIGDWVQTNKTQLLVGFGIGGFVVSDILAFRGGIKASKILEESEVETIGEKAKVTAKCYIWPAVLAVASSASIIYATKDCLDKNIALTAAAALAQQTAIELRDKTAEALGKKNANKVYDKIAEDRIDAHKDEITDIYLPDSQTYPVVESYLGGVFNSNTNEIDRVENVLNKYLREDGRVSMSDLYLQFHKEPPEGSRYFCWDYDDCQEIEFYVTDGHLDNGTPCAVINYYTIPDVCL